MLATRHIMVGVLEDPAGIGQAGEMIEGKRRRWSADGAHADRSARMLRASDRYSAATADQLTSATGARR